MLQSIQSIELRSLKQMKGALDGLIKGRLWVKILIALFLGITAGLLMGPNFGLVPKATARTIGYWLALPGHLFLGIIQMIVIPLIFSSVIRGLAASEDVDRLKRLGLKVIVYFMITTTVAISIGIFLAHGLKPGRFISPDLMQQMTDTEVTGPAEGGAELPSLGELPQQITQILPDNPIVAMVEARMMHIVVFSIFIGIALLTMSPKKSKPLLELLGSLQAVCLTVVGWAMKLAPLAVFGLMAKLTITTGLEGLAGMAGYVGTVLLGLLLLLVFYLLIVTFIGRRSPWRFLKAAREVQLLAFSTSSSAAVMPLSLKTAEEGLKVRPSIAQFMIPLGATSNMDGTALYQGVATVFLAQVFGLELSIAALALVVFTAVTASIGAPATPGVGIVILASVLESAGIPGSGVALIVGVDRILDMSRCVLNVTGDLTACTVMDRLVGGRLTAEEQIRKEEEMERRRLETGEDLIVDGEEAE